MTCINNEKNYSVAVDDTSPNWIDQKGVQSGMKTQIIYNDKSGNDCQLAANNPNLKWGQGDSFLLPAGATIIYKNLNASNIKHYGVCNSALTTTLYITEVTK